MADQYFGTKELYQLTLRANEDFKFGSRLVEEGEPILYFRRAQMTNLYEGQSVKMARGGWGNMPKVIWEDKDELTFTITEGVMNNVSFGFLLGAKVTEGGTESTLAIPRLEGPFTLDENNNYFLDHVINTSKPFFMYEFKNDCIQRKVSPMIIGDQMLYLPDAEPDQTFVMDYYYSYGEPTLSYVIDQSRFNNDFCLEGKFYTKDENEGENITNILVMPRVRVVSNINLHLGERSDPTTSVFRLIAMPSETEISSYELMRITRLGKDVDE